MTGSNSGQTVSSTSGPPPQVLQSYGNLTNAATSVAQNPLNLYGGPMVAGFTPQQQQGFSTIGASQGIGTPFINAAAQEYGQATKPLWPTLPQYGTDTVNKYLSPYTQDVTGALTKLYNQQNAQQTSQIEGNAASQGAFGGDREPVAQALATQQEQLAQAPTLAQVEQQGFTGAQGEFNQQQQTQLGAEQANAWLGSQAGFGLAGLGTQAQTQALTGANAEIGAGGMQQQLGQEQMNIPYEQFVQSQAYPYQQLGFLSPIVEGTGSLSGGTSGTTYPGPSTLGQVAGLGMTGLGLYGLGSQQGWWGGGSPAAGATSAGSFFGGSTDAPVIASRGGRIGYAAGGIPQVSGIGAGVPSVDLSFIPQAAPGGIPTKSGLSPFQPVTTQTSSGGGGGGGVLGALGTVAGFATGMPWLGAVGGAADKLTGFEAGGRVDDNGAGLARRFFAGGGRVHYHYNEGGEIPHAVTLAFADGGGIGAGSANTGFGSLPAVPKPTLDYISSPGPAIKGEGPPKPPSMPQGALDQGLDPGKLLGSMKTVEGILDKKPSDTSGSNTGGRIGYDMGGNVPLAAAVSFGGASPGVQQNYQQLMGLTAERLQEMAAQFPPTTQQGQMVQRALQQKRMGVGIGAGQQQSQQPQPGMADGGSATGPGWVTEDDLDPVPEIDHSGDTVKVRYPSEGKVLDLGIPSLRRKLAAGGAIGAYPSVSFNAGQGGWAVNPPMDGGAWSSGGTGGFTAGNGVQIPQLSMGMYAQPTGLDAGGGIGNWFNPMAQWSPAGAGATGPGGTWQFPSHQAYVPQMGGVISALGGTPAQWAGGSQKRGGRIGFDDGGDVGNTSDTEGMAAGLEPATKPGYLIGMGGEVVPTSLPDTDFGLLPPKHYGGEAMPRATHDGGLLPNPVDFGKGFSAAKDAIKYIGGIGGDREIAPTAAPQHTFEAPFTPAPQPPPHGIGDVHDDPAVGLGAPPAEATAPPPSARPAPSAEPAPETPATPAPQAPASAKAKPAQAALPAPASVAAAGAPALSFYGDSVAHGTREAMSAPGQTHIGWRPDKVLGAFTGADLKGQTAVISSGITNSTAVGLPADQWQKDIALVPQQIDAAHSAGAGSVVLYGVGEGVRDSKNINERLAEIAASKGATFVPLIGTGAYKDSAGAQHPANWHPKDYTAQGQYTLGQLGAGDKGLAPGFVRGPDGLTRNGQPPDTMLPGGVPAWDASGRAPPQVTNTPGGTNGIAPAGAPGSASTAQGAAPLPPVMSSVADALMNSPEAKQLGLTKGNIAGYLGHTVAESAKGGDINPGAYNPTDHPNGGSRGLSQWDPQRWANGQRWAQENGITDFATNPAAQARFGLHEVLTGTDGSNGRTLAALKAAGDDPVKSSLAWAHFERGLGYTPDHPDYMIGQDDRNLYAQQIKTALDGGQPFRMDVAPGRGGSRSTGTPGTDQLVGGNTGRPGLSPDAASAPLQQASDIAHEALTNTPPEHRSAMQEWMKSPYFLAFLTGAGMLASRSHFPGVALGEGLQSAAKGAENIYGLENRQELADSRAQHLSDLTNVRASAAADRATNNQQMMQYRYDNLLRQQQAGDTSAALRQQTAEAKAALDAANLQVKQGTLEVARYKATRDRPAYDPVSGKSGVYRYNPDTGQDEFHEGATIGHAPAVSTYQQMRQEFLKLHPGDEAGALGYAAKQSGFRDAAEYDREVTSMMRNLQGLPAYMSASPQALRSASEQLVLQNRQNAPGSNNAPAAHPAPAAAATAQPAAPGVVIQNGWRYDATTHQPLGPQ